MTSRAGKPDTEADRALRDCLTQTRLQNFVMVAGAGSGKTTSLVKALAHLEQTRGSELRQRGQRVACITYTEVAEREILADVRNVPLFHVSTIHSFLWTLIKPFQEDIRAWVIDHVIKKTRALEAKQAAPRRHKRTLERDQGHIARLNEQVIALRAAKRFTYGTGTDYQKRVLGHETIITMVPELLLERPLLRKLVARRFPFVFVDESQDTNPDVVRALKAVATEAGGEFCLGFFGDPMQKIYPMGVGKIDQPDDWALIKKSENFRSSSNVLSVLNKIRAQSDGLEQKPGHVEHRPGSTGSAHLFVVPGDGKRDGRLMSVRRWMAKETQNPAWVQDEGADGVRILVIVHRMAARRLGFPVLYAALNDKVPDSISNGFLDGTTWLVRPFLSLVLPLVIAFREGRDSDVMSLLRAHCPRLLPEQLVGVAVPALLRRLKEDTERLAVLLAPDGTTLVREALAFIRERQLMNLDGRLVEALDAASDPATPGDTVSEEDAVDSEDGAVSAFLNCPVTQLWGYRTYIEKESPFFTQQGVKGTEFERVLTVVDDDEGSHNQFSYNKYFGVTELSATDRENRDSGKETVVERTRRLFYVCCSRAIQDLAVVVFAKDVAGMALKIQQTGLFPHNQVRIFDELL